AAVLFETRSILDCADGTLARAKSLMSPTGHAIDAMADWLGVIFLYAGIFVHFRLHPPDPSAWGGQLNANGVLLLALCQGAVRSFASDYYRVKYCSIFEQGRDDTVEALRKKVLALGPARVPSRQTLLSVNSMRPSARSASRSAGRGSV